MDYTEKISLNSKELFKYQQFAKNQPKLHFVTKHIYPSMNKYHCYKPTSSRKSSSTRHRFPRLHGLTRNFMGRWQKKTRQPPIGSQTSHQIRERIRDFADVFFLWHLVPLDSYGPVIWRNHPVWNPTMEVWFRWCSFSIRWCLGSFALNSQGPVYNLWLFCGQ